MSRAISLAAARAAGLHEATDPPMGTWQGKLIAKAWGRHTNVLCYFEHSETGEIHRCSAYKNWKKSIYSSRDDVIDFSQEGIEGNSYLLETGLNKNGNVSWLKSSLLSVVSNGQN
jgi:hypothetical protein